MNNIPFSLGINTLQLIGIMMMMKHMLEFSREKKTYQVNERSMFYTHLANSKLSKQFLLQFPQNQIIAQLTLRPCALVFDSIYIPFFCRSDKIN